MTRATQLAVCGAAVGLICGAAALQGDESEQGLELGAVPASVTEAAGEAVEGFKAESVAVEAVLIYEVEGEAAEREWELEITGEGTVIEQDDEADEEGEQAEDDSDAETDAAGDDADERHPGDRDDAGAEEEDGAEHELAVPVSALPEAVVRAAKKAVEGLQLEEGEVESVLVYELTGHADGRKVEIEVTSEGDVIEIERE